MINVNKVANMFHNLAAISIVPNAIMYWVSMWNKDMNNVFKYGVVFIMIIMVGLLSLGLQDIYTRRRNFYLNTL